MSEAFSYRPPCGVTYVRLWVHVAGSRFAESRSPRARHRGSALKQSILLYLLCSRTVQLRGRHPPPTSNLLSIKSGTFRHSAFHRPPPRTSKPRAQAVVFPTHPALTLFRMHDWRTRGSIRCRPSMTIVSLYTKLEGDDRAAGGGFPPMAALMEVGGWQHIA